MPENAEEAVGLEIPFNLQRFTSPVGIHRRGMKVLVFGPPDSGKSYFLAHMPSPKVVIDANEEGGIQAYLRPNDTYFNMSHPEAINDAIGFVLNNEGRLASLAIDGMSGMWEEFMDYWAKKLGGEIQAQDWRKVKAPWKLFLKRVMRSRMNVGFSAWLKDTVYDQGEGPMKKLDIRRVDVPQIEKTVPYTVDFIFKCETQLDRKSFPTPIKVIRVYKARRPRSIPPSELFAGKEWKFDQRSPVDPWLHIIEPLVQRWEEGAVDHLGSDPMEEQYELRGLDDVMQDNELARILRLIKDQTNYEQYKMVWAKEIDPALRSLSEQRLAMVTEAHARKRAELQGK